MRLTSRATDWILVEPRRYLVRVASELVEAWSTFRLPFQPSADGLALRSELRDGIRGLAAGPDQILECHYRSAKIDLVDTENVLIYNVGESAFSKVAGHGIRFERVFEEPPPCPETLSGPGALHYVAYRTIALKADFTHWQRGKPIAIWESALWPTGAGTSPTPFWLAIRQASPHVLHASREPMTYVGLQVNVAGGTDSIRPARMIKPLFDAAISAFHVHNEPVAMAKAIERLVARGHGSAAALGQLLTDPQFDVLGPRNLVATYRAGVNTDGVKWNPEDERCVAGELLWAPADGPKRFSGELFEVHPGHG